jgi:hypothetical protein
MAAGAGSDGAGRGSDVWGLIPVYGRTRSTYAGRLRENAGGIDSQKEYSELVRLSWLNPTRDAARNTMKVAYKFEPFRLASHRLFEFSETKSNPLVKVEYRP